MLKNLTKAFVWKPETKRIHKTASKQTEEVEERPISYRIHKRTHIQTHASHTRNSTSASTHIYLMQTRRPHALVCLSRINANTKKDNWFVEQSYYIRLRTIRSILLEFCCHHIQCFDSWSITHPNNAVLLCIFTHRKASSQITAILLPQNEMARYLTAYHSNCAYCVFC